ncbi:hypothetical protein MAJJADAN_00066 [Pseudomonas phage Amjad_SA]|nr:hypothetical protein MAJJADAN_00066 [Pseudomonas phage Amjad_SA]
MSGMVEVKVSELSGPALDWAAGVAEGNPMMGRVGSDVVWSKYHGSYQPSIDWSQGGPLIEKYAIDIGQERDEPAMWVGLHKDWTPETAMYGPTPLIAACRAIVSAKLGDLVQIPQELMP